MSAEKLLPCPFCGGTNTDPEGWMGEHWVSCGTCDASARMTGTLKTACEAWNRRTHPAPIKPSGDTGELRERVAREVCRIVRTWQGFKGTPEYTLDMEVENAWDDWLTEADAILDLIQPSGDTGELRERVAEAKEWIDEAECRRGCSTWRPDVHGRSRCDCGREDALNAILDLIQSERP